MKCRPAPFPDDPSTSARLENQAVGILSSSRRSPSPPSSRPGVFLPTPTLPPATSRPENQAADPETHRHCAFALPTCRISALCEETCLVPLLFRQRRHKGAGAAFGEPARAPGSFPPRTSPRARRCAWAGALRPAPDEGAGEEPGGSKRAFASATGNIGDSCPETGETRSVSASGAILRARFGPRAGAGRRHQAVPAGPGIVTGSGFWVARLRANP
jgi:hypothetical protein